MVFLPRHPPEDESILTLPGLLLALVAILAPPGDGDDPPRRLHGRITHEGQPASMAVVLHSRGPDGRWPLLTLGTTDETGFFSLVVPDGAPGDAVVVLRGMSREAPGQGDQPVHWAQRVDLEDPRPLVLELQDSPTATGRLTRDGLPLEASLVELLPDALPVTPARTGGRTGPDGSFQLVASHGPGPYTLVVRMPWPCPRALEYPVKVEPDGALDLEIELPPSPVLTIDFEGSCLSPLSPCVTVHPVHTSDHGLALTGLREDIVDGRKVIRGVPCDGPYALVFTLPHDMEQVSEIEVRGNTIATAPACPGGRIEVALADSVRTRPLTSGTVTLRPLQTAEGAPRPARQADARGGGAQAWVRGIGTARSLGPQGRQAFAGLPPGLYSIEAWVRGVADLNRTVIRLEAGETRRVELEGTLMSALRGRVDPRFGSRGTVRLYDEDGHRRGSTSVRSWASGELHYDFPTVQPGSYEAVLTTDRGVEWRLTVDLSPGDDRFLDFWLDGEPPEPWSDDR